MVNDSPWSCHQVDPPSWLFRRWPLLEWSSTSPKPHSYPPSILTATHWMFINDYKKSYCWTFHCSSRFFLTHIDAISASLPRLSMSCRLWVAVVPTIRKALHSPHELPHKSTASSFHWETPYSPALLLTVYNQILVLFHLPLMGFFKHVILCWSQQKRPEGHQITLSGLWWVTDFSCKNCNDHCDLPASARRPRYL